MDAGRERRLAGASSGRELPALWKGRLAWVRGECVLRAILGLPVRSRRIPAPPGGGWTGLDLRVKRIAASRDEAGPEDHRSRVCRLSVDRSAPALVATASTGGESRHVAVSPRLAGGGIRFAVRSGDRGGFSGLVAVSYSGRDRRRVRGPAVGSVAWDGGRVLRGALHGLDLEGDQGCGDGCTIDHVQDPFR